MQPRVAHNGRIHSGCGEGIKVMCAILEVLSIFLWYLREVHLWCSRLNSILLAEWHPRTCKVGGLSQRLEGEHRGAIVRQIASHPKKIKHDPGLSTGRNNDE